MFLGPNGVPTAKEVIDVFIAKGICKNVLVSVFFYVCRACQRISHTPITTNMRRTFINFSPIIKPDIISGYLCKRFHIMAHINHFFHCPCCGYDFLHGLPRYDYDTDFDTDFDSDFDTDFETEVENANADAANAANAQPPVHDELLCRLLTEIDRRVEMRRREREERRRAEGKTLRDWEANRLHG